MAQRSSRVFVPRKLAADSSPYLNFDAANLTVNYTGMGNHSLDFGTARGARAFGARLKSSGGLGYFEVEVLSAGDAG